MISAVVVKTFKRKNAASVSRYNHDERHPDHKGRTDIMEKYSYKSQALEDYGGWRKFDAYEREHQDQGKQNNVAREYIIPLPNHWKDDEQKVESFKERIKDYVCNATGISKDGLVMEMTFHYNHAKDEDQDNFHVHVLVGEREYVTERKQEVYKRDFWQDMTTGRMCKPGAPGGICVHKKGDLKYDKAGNPKYESESARYLSVKNTVLSENSFLEKLKYEVKDAIEELDQTMQMRVGKKGPYNVPYMTYTDEEKRLMPERVRVIKEINKGREVINNNLNDGLKNKVITKDEARETVNRYKTDLEVFKATREKDQGKQSYLESIRDITYSHAIKIHDWVYGKIEQLRVAAAHVLGRDEQVERSRSFHR